MWLPDVGETPASAFHSKLPSRKRARVKYVYKLEDLGTTSQETLVTLIVRHCFHIDLQSWSEHRLGSRRVLDQRAHITTGARPHQIDKRS